MEEQQPGPPPPPSFAVNVAAHLGPASCYNVTLQFQSIPSVDDIITASNTHYGIIAEYSSPGASKCFTKLFLFDAILGRWVQLYNMSQLSPNAQLLTWRADESLVEVLQEIPCASEEIICNLQNRTSERAVQLVSDMGEPDSEKELEIRFNLREQEIKHFESVSLLVGLRQQYLTALETARREKLDRNLRDEASESHERADSTSKDLSSCVARDETETPVANSEEDLATDEQVGPEEDFEALSPNQRRNKYLKCLSEAAVVMEKGPDHGSMIGALIHEGLEMVQSVEQRMKRDGALRDDEAILSVIADLKETANDLKFKYEL